MCCIVWWHDIQVKESAIVPMQDASEVTQGYCRADMMRCRVVNVREQFSGIVHRFVDSFDKSLIVLQHDRGRPWVRRAKVEVK